MPVQRHGEGYRGRPEQRGHDVPGRGIGGVGLVAGHEHINLNEKVTGADGKTIHVVEAGSAFAEVGLLSVPYEYDTKGTESTDDDTVAVYADKSDEKLYTAKDVNVLLTDPNKGSTYQSILDEVHDNKIKPLDDAFSAASSEVLGTSSTNYFYGEDAGASAREAVAILKAQKAS